MTVTHNAARVAVKAAACPHTAAEAEPKEIFDHLAMGSPNEQWAEAQVESIQRLATTRHQVALSGLIQIEAFVSAILSLTPMGPENCASRSLLHRLNQLNTAVLGAVLDEGEEIADLQKVVDACQ